VEIKCQLDATDEFLLQILLLAQHVSGTIKPIIRSSRVLYKWLLPLVFGAWFLSCRYGVRSWGLCVRFVSMCDMSTLVHTSKTSICHKKNFFGFPVAVKNSIKVGPLVFLL